MSCVTWHLLMLGQGLTGVYVCVHVRKRKSLCVFVSFLQHYPTTCKYIFAQLCCQLMNLLKPFIYLFLILVCLATLSLSFQIIK